MTLSKRRKLVIYVAILAALTLIMLWLLLDDSDARTNYTQDPKTNSNYEMGVVRIDFGYEPNVGFANNLENLSFPVSTQWRPGGADNDSSFNDSIITAGLVIENHSEIPVTLSLSIDDYVDPVTKIENLNTGLCYTVYCYKTDGTDPAANGILSYLDNNISSDEVVMATNTGLSSFVDSSVSSITLKSQGSYILRYAFWIDNKLKPTSETSESENGEALYGVTISGLAQQKPQ